MTEIDYVGELDIIEKESDKWISNVIKQFYPEIEDIDNSIDKIKDLLIRDNITLRKVYSVIPITDNNSSSNYRVEHQFLLDGEILTKITFDITTKIS